MTILCLIIFAVLIASWCFLPDKYRERRRAEQRARDDAERERRIWTAESCDWCGEPFDQADRINGEIAILGSFACHYGPCAEQWMDRAQGVRTS